MRRWRGKGNTHDQRRAGPRDNRLFSLERLADEEVPGVEYSVGGGEVKFEILSSELKTSRIELTVEMNPQ
jgi:hypothetical protein